MKKMSKILSVVLSILMVITVIPITASAATYSGTCGENLTWAYDSSTYTLTISGTGAMYDYETDNRPWESYEDKIKIIIVEDGVTTIGARAFYDCQKILKATLADSILTIGRTAFAYCDNLSNVTLGNDLSTIGYGAFYSCDKLESISIPDSVTEIGEYAFRECKKLKNINIPDGVEIIKAHTFNYCDSLESITIPNSVTEIGESAFYGCDGLVEIVIPDSVTTIGKTAFEYCDNLAKVTFGKGLTVIDKFAFAYCNSLENVTIPSNVISIETGAFAGCENLLNITVDSNNPYFSNDENGILFNKDKTILIQYPLGSDVAKYTIPDSVSQIGRWSFYSCSNLAEITIPNTVTVIESPAFSYKQTVIIYYEGTAEQWNNALEKNSEIPTHWYDDYYIICSDKTIYPSGSCGENVTWEFNKVTGVLTISGIGEMDNYELSYTGFYGQPWESFSDSIKEVIIEDGVTTIGDCAFASFDNLTTISISNSVSTIGKEALYHCDNLANVTIGDGVTTIKEKAFYYCTSLTSMVIPINVTSIGDNAFIGCSGITDVYYEGTEEQWNDNFVIYNGYITPPTEPFGNATIHYNHHIHRGTQNSVVTAPTCTAQGYTTFTCECGESYVGDYVDALGHSEKVIPAVAPTCTETGLTEGVKCSVCGETLTEQKELPANGHTPANAVEENYVAPTCTENGSKDVVVYCSVCEDEISRETVVINATGHSYTSVVTPPTCTEQGYTTYTCDCGETYVDDYLNATGHADNDGDGYCDADNELIDPSVECDHICHKDGILGFVWRIINVFNMLFSLNKTCDCSLAHY